MPTQGSDPAGSADAQTIEGQLATDFLTRVGVRVRDRRKARGLTVTQLSDRAGISRRLLTQIEHGQANPSLVGVTRIARELGTDFTTLLDDAQQAVLDVHAADEHTLVWSTDAGSAAHLLVSTAQSRRADLWRWHLVPGDSYRGQADPEGSQELFYVLAGELEVAVDDRAVTIPTSCSARLRSDRGYVYRNPGTLPCTFVRVVSLSS